MRAPFQILAIPYRKRGSSVEFCVLHRSDIDQWQFIAGGGEDDEKPPQSAKREIHEETGVQVDTLIPLTSMCHIPASIFPEKYLKNWAHDTYVVPEYSFAFKCISDIVLSHEHIECAWLPYDEAFAKLKWDSNRTALYELKCRLEKINRTYSIIILGANGSGKSTLGCELARGLNFVHFDVEDYWFYKTDIPYTAIRPQEERKEMLLSDMKKHGSFVVSGDISGWGDEFITMFDLVVFLTAPKEIRMKRIEKREYARWGDRVCEGGDMYESQKKFREFAATRNVDLFERGALKYLCPVLRIDSTITLNEMKGEIIEYMKEL